MVFSNKNQQRGLNEVVRAINSALDKRDVTLAALSSRRLTHNPSVSLPQGRFWI
jgi:hypothetical protein